MPIQRFGSQRLKFGCIALGHQYSYPDLFKSPLDLITGRGHRLALFLPLPVEGESIHQEVLNTGVTWNTGQRVGQ
jgi:hypothetical protein